MGESLYTAVFRKSASAWVALCLENGVAGQGRTKEEVLEKLKEAIASFEGVRETEKDVYVAPISIGELHEFLTLEERSPSAASYELRTVCA